MSKYTTQSTSYNSARIEEPIVIYETDTTRRIFVADINDVKTSTKETVSGTIIHQRKRTNDIWEDVEAINLSSLKSGEGVKLHFKSSHLRNLYQGLQELYQLSEKGVYLGKRKFIVGEAERFIEVPENRKEFIQKLIAQNYGEEIWDELIDSNPDLVKRLSMARIQNERNMAVSEFEENITQEDLSEEYWQIFFKKNQWIFGYGLNYCFLSQISDQPHYGGANFTGLGDQRGDFMLNSNAATKFTVLVEIKKPSTNLLAKKNGQFVKYRNGAYRISSELTGGIAQLQVNCKTWQRSAYEADNYDILSKSGIFTVQPKGILVIGNTCEFENRQQDESFELFRRNIYNPEIITYDELLERAKFIVAHERENEDENIELEEMDF